jgi:Flp pilus assembly pilin Flp
MVCIPVPPFFGGFEMLKSLKRLWIDEAGAIVSAEIVLVSTILVLGMITGLTSLRDGVITELADVGAAIGSVSQAYSVGPVVSHSAAVAGFAYADLPDFCDAAGNVSGARCLLINGGALAADVSGTNTDIATQ